MTDSTQSGIMPSRADAWEALERQRLVDENRVLREAVEFYAKPRTYGSGEHAIFLDDCGVARAALRTIRGEE